MKDVKTKRALGPLGRGVDAHSAGLGTIAAMRSAIVLGPECPDRSRSRARPVLRKQKTLSPSKQHTHVRTMYSGAGSTGWLEREAAGNSERTSGHLAQGMCAPKKKKRTHPPTTFEVLLRAWARGTIAAMRSAIVLGPECPDRSRSRARPVLRKQKTLSPSKQHTHVRTMYSFLTPFFTPFLHPVR